MYARSGLCLIVLSLAATLVAAQPQTPAANPVAARGGKPATSAASGWNDLSPGQQQALQPLASNWNNLSDGQRRKWLALSQNFATMSPAEQATLHSRMTEWAALSAKQRAEARLNFAKTRQLPAEEKKAKWEAYQALSPEEKSKLAARTGAKPTGAALAVKPVPAQKLAQVPETKRVPRKSTPGRAVLPPQVNQNTLLPRNAANTAPSAPERKP